MESWNKVLDIIKENIGEGAFKAWFEDISFVSLQENTIFLEITDEFRLSWVLEHYSKILKDVILDVFGKEFEIKFLVKKKVEEDKNGVIYIKREESIQSNLIDRYTFDSFVVGKCNEFAYSAALAVSKSPGRTYNPLFLYGGVGLGKTHLMNAIGNFVKDTFSNLKILYIPTEVFLNEMIQALQNNRMMDFKNKFRNLDILLIDDIHFLSNKESLQEEFFHTFNTLYNEKKQIVITSDRPPRELVALQERIISRFMWGLIVDLQPPDFETRLAILRKKSEEDGIQLNEELLNFLATNIKSNIRSLEGAIIKLLYWSSITKNDITLDVAREVLKDIIIPMKSELTADDIIKTVCNFFNVSISDIIGKSRMKNVVLPRQISIYLMRNLTRLSLKEIGKLFMKDHTTIIHSIEKVQDLKKDKKMKELIERITSELEGGKNV